MLFSPYFSKLVTNGASIPVSAQLSVKVSWKHDASQGFFGHDFEVQ